MLKRVNNSLEAYATTKITSQEEEESMCTLIKGQTDVGGHIGAFQRPNHFSGHTAFHSSGQLETVKSIYFAVCQAELASVCGNKVNRAHLMTNHRHCVASPYAL